jgi:hypothetical protein
VISVSEDLLGFDRLGLAEWGASERPALEHEVLYCLALLPPVARVGEEQ